MNDVFYLRFHVPDAVIADDLELAHATRTSEKMTFVNVVDYLKALGAGLPAGEVTQDGPEGGNGNGNIAPSDGIDDEA